MISKIKMASKKTIPNPNQMTNGEIDFIKDQNNVFKNNETDKYKGYMISMPISFNKHLINYLKLNPTEGNKSNFIVRIVADYINKKNKN